MRGKLGTFVGVGVTVVVVLLLSFFGGSDAGGARNGPSNSFGEPSQDHCRRKANNPCHNLTVTTCFGVKLPYSLTSYELVNENYTHHQLQNEMKRWESLRSVPRCWAVIQPLLCSIYMPKCEDDFISLPPQDLCRVIKKPCAVIEKALREWPEILRCEDTQKFPQLCSSNKNNDLRELKFNTSSTCIEPLKAVDSEFNYYEGFEGCAFNCTNPLFTKEEHERVNSLILYSGLISIALNLFVVLTYCMDWKSSRRYPSVAIFYVNLGYFVATFGWMISRFPNTKDDVVCRKDTTVRRHEPGSGENIFCPLVSGLIYFGTIFALTWLSVFAYVYNLTCQGFARIGVRVDKKRVYFNVIGWLVPIVFTVVSMAVGEVEGNSLTGVCFMNLQDSNWNLVLLMLPLSVTCVLCKYFNWRGIYRLMSVAISDYAGEKGRKKVKQYAIRVGLFSIGLLAIVVTFVVFQILLMNAQPRWERSLQENIYCKMNLQGTEHMECELEDKADVRLVIGQVLTFFLGGILVSSLAWTRETYDIWRRWIKRRCGSEEDGDDMGQVAMKKHKLISQAFSKRHQIPVNGRLSLSLQSTHGDPIGLNRMLDPTHLCRRDQQDLEGSQQLNTGTDVGSDVNSEWAAALPHLLDRRGALVPPHSSVSCVSEDYSQRRASFDSNMSEMTAPGGTQGSGSTTKKSSYRWFSTRHRKNMRYPWKRGAGGSSTSLESNTGSQILPRITALINKNQGKFMLNNGNGEVDMIQMQPQQKKTILVREVEIQTSLERLPTTSKHAVALCDKATQSSLVSLHEFGTQTKKTTFKSKKEKKEKGESSKKDKQEHHHHHKQDKGTSGKEEDDEEEEEEDPVSKLLSPI